MNLSSLPPGIVFRSRVLSRRVSDEPQLLNEFLTFYKSFDASEQLWAIDQIPLHNIAGGASAVCQCFQHFSVHLDLEETEILNALHAAISREILKPILKPEERLKYVAPIIIQCVCANINGKWIHLLHTICKMSKTQAVQALAYEKVSALITEDSYFSRICAAHMIAGLCEAGGAIPVAIINQLLENLTVFEMCYQPVLLSLVLTQNQNYVNNVIDQLLTRLQETDPLVAACLSLPKIPEKLAKWMKNVFENAYLSTDILAAAIKNMNKVFDMGLLNEQKLVQMVWSSNLFTSKYYDSASSFYQKAIPFMKESDALAFLKRIISSDSPHSIQMAALLLRNCKTKASVQYVMSFLTSAKALNFFDDWMNLFPNLVKSISIDNAQLLTQSLIHFALIEATKGHLSNRDGSKILGDFDPKKKLKSQSVVKGWRELSQMIEALSHSPCKDALIGSCMNLLQKALEVHSTPLLPAITVFLLSITSEPKYIFEFLDWLLHGNSTKQLFLMKILPNIMKSLNGREMIQKIGVPIAKLYNHQTPLNLKSAILKLLPEFKIYDHDFPGSNLHKIALNIYHKAVKDEDEFMKDTISCVASEYELIEKMEVKTNNENMDISNATTSDNIVKPITSRNKHRPKIKINIKKMAVVKPVHVQKSLPPF